VRLQCGRANIEVEDTLALAAAGRCCFGSFESLHGEPSILVRRARAGADWRDLNGTPGLGGRFRLEGDVLYGDIPDEMWTAESVLRVSWLASTFRQGGLLMHGCSLGWQGRGIAAIGQSGAGKSTLSRLCKGQPGNAALLTDEIVQLFPDGTCFGTPFRSDVENVGQPGPVALRSLLLLEKGSRESLAPVPAARALPILFPQLYWFDTGEGSLGELKRRLMALVDRVGVQQLTFRKDVAVGPFLREWVGS
jgi:hypothetical protein